jgi:hypothetical protein|tara:strand:+ start:426 stop:662 length:237 start_codon:yes stop_codon:yes gene_type:complete
MTKEYKPRALRKLARQLAKGKPERELIEQKVGKNKTCLVNRPDSVRGVYRQLKKDVKRLGVGHLRELGEEYERQSKES